MKEFYLPKDHRPYTDKYFLRANEVLKAEGLNPRVWAQVMIRHGPGRAFGIDEAVSILNKYSNLKEHGGKVYALKEGSLYNPLETLMLIKAPIRDIVELETMYLGVLSAETTLFNASAKSCNDINHDSITKKASEIYNASEKRPIIYMGARHWRFDLDAAITSAAYDGGVRFASTDIGAATFCSKGVGTIPHVLENIMAWKYGKSDAVRQATIAFDKAIDPKISRIALIDYNNKEINDAIATADALESRLYAVRIDTCGENIGQGAIAKYDKLDIKRLFGKDIEIPKDQEEYWFGTGVTITGTYAMRKALDETGHKDVNIVLSSGFGDVKKVDAFVNAEKIIGTRLFDILGVGGLFDSWHSKMDIVAVGNNENDMKLISKAGREYRPNDRLELIIG